MTFRTMQLWGAAAIVALLPGFASANPPDDGTGSTGATAAAAAPATSGSASGTAQQQGSTNSGGDDPQPPGGQVIVEKSPPPSSPLALKVGDAELLIGGFMDAAVISRDVNTGNGIGTSFGTIPFGNTFQGNLPETKFSAQNSRLTLQATTKVGGADVKGYLEVDFLGNAPNGLNVTSNSNTLRMRLYWVQYRNNKFEFLAGQSWSMMTPNRNGLSPMPGDIFYSQDYDTNYQMGLTWARTTGFRFILHGSDAVTAGVALENPEQYVGTGVVLPAAFPAAEVDAGGVTTNVANPYPDIIGKIALDPKTGSTHQHFDAAVLFRGYKTYNPASSTTNTANGTGYEIGANLEPVHNFHFVATYFGSDGGGRYIANTNLPDFIVNADGSMTTVKSRSYIVGPEFAFGKSLIYFYYSEAHADQALATDTNGKQIGFGTSGNNVANNKIIEPTIGLTQTFYRDPKYGGVQLMLQYSQVKRTPFSVPAGTPTDAKANMFYINVRYVLP